MNHGFKCLTLALAMIAAIPAHADHWKLISFTDSTYTSSDPVYVSRSARSNRTVTLPSGLVYGSGPFPFYGESTTFSKTVVTPNPGLQSFAENSDAYYIFKYKWIPDLPTDVHPPIGTSGGVSGYSLERAKVSLTNQTPLGLYYFYGGIWSWTVLFNAQGPVWSGTSIPPDFNYQERIGPLVGDSPVVTIGTDLFFVRPVTVGGGLITLENGTDVILTVTVLNSQAINLSTPVQCSDPSVTSLGYRNYGFTTCYKGAAEFLNIPVVP